MSSGKRVRLSLLESFAGYAGRVDMLAGGGGMVDCIWVSNDVLTCLGVKYRKFDLKYQRSFI